MATVAQNLLRKYVSGPDHPAKLRIVRRLTRHLIPAEGVLCEVAGGIRMYLHPQDSLEGALYRGQDWEPATLDFLGRNLRPGQTALFAGANSGFHAIRAAKIVGERG